MGRKYTVNMSGTTAFSYIEDVARIFIGCTRAQVDGAPCFNIRGEIDTTERFIELGASWIEHGENIGTVFTPLLSQSQAHCARGRGPGDH